MIHFNYKVHQDEVSQLISNDFKLEARRIDSFGLFPKFELNGMDCAFVVEAEPLSGIWGGIMSWMFPWRDENPKAIYVSNPSGWTEYVTVYPLKAHFSSHIKGCIIHTKREDRFEILYPVYDSGIHYDFYYDVFITATVDPIIFYNFLKTKGNTELIKSVIKKLLLERIAAFYEENGADFALECELNDEILQKAGYAVNKCTIRYASVKKQ